MFSNKINISSLIVILVTVIPHIESLVELPIVEDNNIAAVETAIRNTVNKLFAAFKIEKGKYDLTLKQLSSIHNFFVSITLKDCDNLREIARLTRVNDINNDTQHFITQINEVLNEDDKSNEATDSNNVYVTKYIDMFIRKLKYLKDIYIPDKNPVINENILKYLGNQGSPLVNVSEHIAISKTHVSNENVLGNNEFWAPSGRRIFEGIRTDIKTFPFIASIQFFKKFQCAGSIIKDDLIITSASCLQLAFNNRFFRENPAFLSVQVGSDMYETGGDNIAVFEITFHPRYNPNDLKNNLALIRLTRKIKFNRKQKRVLKIDFDRNPVPMALNVNRIIVIGWGAKDGTNIISDIFSNILSYAELDYYPLMDCQEHYSDEFVTEKNFCAGFYSVGSGACNRDAGGPGIVDGTLMGVISFGSPICGAPDTPTVFTKLGYYADWIETIMEQNVTHHGARTTTLGPYTTFSLDLHYVNKFINVTPIMHHTSPPPKYVNNLRVAEDQGFKDFLSTMFNSEDIEEYFNEASTEVTKGIYDNLEIDTEQILPIKQSVKSGYLKHNKKETMDSADEKILVDTSDEGEDVNEWAESTKEPIRAVTVIENASNDREVSVESDIMTLINNLDLDTIIKPENNDEHTTDTKQLDLTEENNADEKLVERSSPSSESADNVNNYDQEIAAENYLLSSLEKQEDEEGGLSIPTDNFKDLTFREISNTNKTKGVLSASSFAELISMAIDDEAKRLKSKHYIL